MPPPPLASTVSNVDVPSARRLFPLCGWIPRTKRLKYLDALDKRPTSAHLGDI